MCLLSERAIVRGGLKFKVCMCLCMRAGRLLIICPAKDDPGWPNSIQKWTECRGGGRGGGGAEVQPSSRKKKNLTIQFFCLDVFSLLHVFLICSNILRPCDCVKVSWEWYSGDFWCVISHKTEAEWDILGCKDNICCHFFVGDAHIVCEFH